MPFTAAEIVLFFEDLMHSLDPDYLINDFSADNQKIFSNSQSSQFDAAHTFQVKLHGLIMMHKASL